MRGGLLAAGILLLIFGMFLYFTGNNMIQQIEAYDVYDIPISELIKTLSSSAQSQYKAGQQMVMFGSIFGIIGFILCIAGIAAPKNEERVIEKREYHTPKTDRRCPNCGRIISEKTDFCQFCGKKFTSFSDTPASNIYQKVKDFKEGKSSNQDYRVLDEKEINYAESTKEMYKKAHDFQYKKNDIDKAHFIYKKIIDEYPDSDEAIYAKQQINSIESTDNFKKDTNSKKNEQNKEGADKETEEKEIEKERFCFECGAKLEGSPKFCPMCGTKQEES